MTIWFVPSFNRVIGHLKECQSNSVTWTPILQYFKILKVWSQCLICRPFKLDEPFTLRSKITRAYKNIQRNSSVMVKQRVQLTDWQKFYGIERSKATASQPMYFLVCTINYGIMLPQVFAFTICDYHRSPTERSWDSSTTISCYVSLQSSKTHPRCGKEFGFQDKTVEIWLIKSFLEFDCNGLHSQRHRFCGFPVKERR